MTLQVSAHRLNNKELDKLVGALGRSKVTWRRALLLHDWLQSIGHPPDDRLCTTLIRCEQRTVLMRSDDVENMMQARNDVCLRQHHHPNELTMGTSERCVSCCAGCAPSMARRCWPSTSTTGCARQRHRAALA